MGRYIIDGGRAFHGDIRVQGAKNAVLALFAGAILTSEEVVIHDCPDLLDVYNMGKLLQSLGVSFERRGTTVIIKSDELSSDEISCCLARELRSSIFLLGSVLGRDKRAKVSYPGGCDIGLRPIDIHLKALSELGVNIREKYGYIYCDATRMRGGAVTLDYPSVGATENIMLLTAISNGVTTISNAAREPEIVDLQNFLNAMGARITGGGSSFIRIEGVDKLHGVEYTVMPDRIVAGTFLTAAAACGGELKLTNVVPEHFSALTAKLIKSGCKITEEGNSIIISSSGRLTSAERIETQPYPGFPTDLQAPYTVLASIQDGMTIITENIFETRFKHIPELIRMGAQITVRDRNAIVKGVEALRGAEVAALDLRGGAALVIAGLAAQGTTIVNGSKHIERGYDGLEKLLTSVGASIEKI